MGLQIIKSDTRINFIGFRKWAFILSALVLILGIGSLIMRGGPRYGIDFAGGVDVQIKFSQQVDLEKVKESLADIGLKNLVVQRFGPAEENVFLLRSSIEEIDPESFQATVTSNLKEDLSNVDFEVQSLEMVGTKVGADFRSKAMEALFYAVLLIAIYISGRFEQRWFAAAIMAGGLFFGIYVLKLISLPMAFLILAALIITLILCWYLKLNFALGAVVALVHDVLITIGIFSLLNKEFDLTIVAALLTIIGYSLNDTIIVFDRIRENMRSKISSSLATTINTSINQTLSRTLLTSGTTLLVVLSLFFFGGSGIHDFAFALLVGVIVGTYSSVYVASPVLLGFRPQVEEKETAE